MPDTNVTWWQGTGPSKNIIKKDRCLTGDQQELVEAGEMAIQLAINLNYAETVNCEGPDTYTYEDRMVRITASRDYFTQWYYSVTVTDKANEYYRFFFTYRQPLPRGGGDYAIPYLHVNETITSYQVGVLVKHIKRMYNCMKAGGTWEFTCT